MSVETWTVAEAIRRVTSSSDMCFWDAPAGWLELFADKCGDSKRMGYLLEDLEESGQLDPVCIVDGALGNGHHRLVLAVLLGWDTIRVDTSNWYTERSDANSFRTRPDHKPPHEHEPFFLAVCASLDRDQANESDA